MRIYRCEPCGVNWAAFHTRTGVCVICNGGTRTVQEPVDPQAELLYRHALAIEARDAEIRKARVAFEEFWAALLLTDLRRDLAAWNAASC